MNKAKEARVEAELTKHEEYRILQAREVALKETAAFYEDLQRNIQRDLKNAARTILQWKQAIKAPPKLKQQPQVENAWTRIDRDNEMGVYILIEPQTLVLKYAELSEVKRHEFRSKGASSLSCFRLTRPPLLVRINIPLKVPNVDIKMFDYERFVQRAKGKYLLATQNGVYCGYPHPQIGPYGKPCWGHRHTLEGKGGYGSLDDQLKAWWKEEQYAEFVNELRQYIRQVRDEAMYANTYSGHPFVSSALEIVEVNQDGEKVERKEQQQPEEVEGSGGPATPHGGADAVADAAGLGIGEGQRAGGAADDGDDGRADRLEDLARRIQAAAQRPEHGL